jgi:hypothetical protein
MLECSYERRIHRSSRKRGYYRGWNTHTNVRTHLSKGTSLNSTHIVYLTSCQYPHTGTWAPGLSTWWHNKHYSLGHNELLKYSTKVTAVFVPVIFTTFHSLFNTHDKRKHIYGVSYPYFELHKQYRFFFSQSWIFCDMKKKVITVYYRQYCSLLSLQ